MFLLSLFTFLNTTLLKYLFLDKEVKPRKKAAVVRKRSESVSGSEDEEEEAPSDGGGSDYEPDEPIKVYLILNTNVQTYIVCMLHFCASLLCPQ